MTSSYVPAMLPPSILLIAVFYYISYAFLKTTRPLMRLLGVSSAPVFSQASSSMEGLATIRTFGIEPLVTEDFNEHLVNFLLQ